MAAADAAAKEEKMGEEIHGLRQSLAAEGQDRDVEVLDLRQKLAAAAARAQASIGKESKRIIDAAEDRATAAEADAAQLRANISDIEAAAAQREDSLRSEAAAAEARLRAAEVGGYKLNEFNLELKKCYGFNP
jgi:hypothetical protein